MVYSCFGALRSSSSTSHPNPLPAGISHHGLGDFRIFKPLLFLFLTQLHLESFTFHRSISNEWIRLLLGQPIPHQIESRILPTLSKGLILMVPFYRLALSPFARLTALRLYIRRFARFVGKSRKSHQIHPRCRYPQFNRLRTGPDVTGEADRKDG